MYSTITPSGINSVQNGGNQDFNWTIDDFRFGQSITSSPATVALAPAFASPVMRCKCRIGAACRRADWFTRFVQGLLTYATINKN